MTLRLTGVVVKRNGYLQVANSIYATVFDRHWVESALGKLRPYSEAFKAWVESGYTDESRLLRGQALKEALAWAASRGLNDLDYQFLTVSQDFERREVQRTLEAQTKANQILAEAQQQAEEKLEQAEQKLQEAREGSRLERLGIKALQQFESTQIEALILAIQSGVALRTLVQDGRTLKDYPAISPLLALQIILNQISEWNRLSCEHNVTSLSFSPNNDILALAFSQGTVELRNLSGKLENQWQGHKSGIKYICFSPDGKLIATASSDHTACLWDVSGQKVARLNRHSGTVSQVCFSPNGELMATSSLDGTVRIWNVAGQFLFQLLTQPAKVNTVSFSPNGELIAIGKNDKTVELWHVHKGQVLSWTAHQSSVTSIVFSHSEDLLATAEGKGTIKLWDLSGKLVNQFQDQSWLNRICFSPSGHLLAAGSTDRTVSLWDLNGHLIEQFKHIALRL